MNTPRWLLSILGVLTSAQALAAELPNLNVANSAPAERAVLDRSALPPAVVTSRDARRGVPTFLLAPQSPVLTGSPALGTPESAALFWLTRYAGWYGLSPAALQSAQVEKVLDTGRGGVVVTFRQRPGGVEVFHSDAKVLLDRQLRLVALSGALHPAAVPGGKAGAFRLGEAQAAARALRDVEGVTLAPDELRQLERTQGSSHFFELATARTGLRFVEPVRVKPVYFALPQRLVAAYFVELLVQPGAERESDAYAEVIGAEDGALLYRENLTHRAAFGYRVFAEATGDHRPFDGPIADFTPHPTGQPDGSYPSFVSANLVTLDGFNAPQDPWLAAGATVTSGNNVDAYTDDDSPDGFSSGDLRATATSGAFDFLYDLTQDPQANDTQRMASVTNLFYVNNWLHDWWYDSGFTESAGNAQQDNYGRGGVAGDPLHAEAQDGAPSKRDNSNMNAMSDGTSPRMQMYVWDGVTTTSLVVSPGGSLSVGLADFGPATFNVPSTAVVLANDGAGVAVTDACEPITNSVTGMVVLVDRGNCSFKFKALNVQQAGGVGMILVNNRVATTPPPMGDDPTVTSTISIPSLSVTLDDGNSIKAALQNGPVTAAMSRSTGATVDGSLDNSVVAHEWGHYLHLRQVACGNQQCSAQSEGWGDFTALQMVIRPGDNLDGTFALAQYATASFPNAGYFGVRRYPYSTDLTRNPLTFADIASGQALPGTAPLSPSATGDNSEVHNAGEIWAQMLFEGFVALLKDTQSASPRYTFDEARRRMSDYVEGALQLAPVDPTYTEQRDALLAAATAADPQDAALLVQAFAKRGAGTCAVSPARDSTDLTGVVEDFSVMALPQVVSMTLDDSTSSCDHDGALDAAESGKLKLTVVNSGVVAWSGSATVSSTLAGLTFPSGASANFTNLVVGQPATVTLDVALDPSVAGVVNVPLHVEFSPATSCDGGVDSADLSLYANYDIGHAATDDVEAPVSAWTPEGTGAAQVWTRQPVGAGHAWVGINSPSPSDTALVSPALQVSAADPLTLSFSTRYSFEASQGVNWDGAVIELSTDNGTTWADISAWGNPGYTGTIGDPANQATNVLKGRQGYTGTNASWPARDTVSINLGTALAGQSVLLRFRIGTDDATGDFGWELDDLAVGGITNLPFTTLVGDDTQCPPAVDAGPVDVDAGAPDAGGAVAAGSTGTASSTTGATAGSTSGGTTVTSTSASSTTGSASSTGTVGSTSTSTSSSATSTSGSATGTSGTSASATSGSSGATSSSTSSSSTGTTGSGSSTGSHSSSSSAGSTGSSSPSKSTKTGGCGCSSRSGSLGSLAPFLALGLVHLARRRRR